MQLKSTYIMYIYFIRIKVIIHLPIRFTLMLGDHTITRQHSHGLILKRLNERVAIGQWARLNAFYLIQGAYSVKCVSNQKA